jgi:D-alanine-D-alanine ligase
MLGIPYSGSDPLTLAATLDKDVAKRIVAPAGVSVAAGVVLHPNGRGGVEADHLHLSRLAYPVIVKPAWEGSSKGIRGKCVVDSRAELLAAANALFRAYSQPVLAEEYIEGEELTVGLVGNDSPEAVGILRVVPQRPTERFVYSLEVKRDWQRQVRYEGPASLPPGVRSALEVSARNAYRALGCRDVARIDFRLRQGRAYFLEVNPLPGLNPVSSDLVIMARLSGWSYERLIAGILHAAFARQGLGANAAGPLQV